MSSLEGGAGARHTVHGLLACLHAVHLFCPSLAAFPLHSDSAAKDERSTPCHFDCDCDFKCNKRADTV